MQNSHTEITVWRRSLLQHQNSKNDMQTPESLKRISGVWAVLVALPRPLAHLGKMGLRKTNARVGHSLVRSS